MDASRSDLDYVAQVFTAVIEAGATTLNFPDTVGYAIPQEFGAKIKYLVEHIPNIHQAMISVHCHNDLGLAVANTLAAIMNGARQVEVTINGLGERAGNASLEEVVMALATRKDLFDYYTDIVTQYIAPTSRLTSKLSGVPVQPNKAIVGANAFAHESGIHQDGVLKEASTFEIMTPTTVGIKKSLLVLGKLSGRHAFKNKLQEMGYYLADEELNRVFSRFKDLADRKKKVFDEDLVSLVETEVIYKSVPEHFRLLDLVVLSGTTVKPNATVKMQIGGEVKTLSAFGDGPMDAAYRAITELAKSKCTPAEIRGELHHRGHRGPGGGVGAPGGGRLRGHRPGSGPGHRHRQRPGLYQRLEPPSFLEGNGPRPQGKPGEIVRSSSRGRTAVVPAVSGKLLQPLMASNWVLHLICHKLKLWPWVVRQLGNGSTEPGHFD